LPEEQTPTSTLPPITFDGIATSSGKQTVDFSQFVDSTPLAVHPQLPLETVMEFFKKMGPRVILVEHRGQLTGLVTVKDCLKYQFKVEAQEHSRDDSGGEARQEAMGRHAKSWGLDRRSHTGIVVW
jgi:chloride channel 3/4/5